MDSAGLLLSFFMHIFIILYTVQSETVWYLIPLCVGFIKGATLENIIVLSPPLFFSFYHSLSVSVCSSRVGVSWQWCCRTLWPAVCLSSACRRARPWSCWRDLVRDQAGVWCALRIRARLRKVWCPAQRSVSPTPAAVLRWTASSLQAKVRIWTLTHFFISL